MELNFMVNKHMTPFKQWQLLLHPSPKVPLSHSVIRNHSNNEKEIFVNENNNQCQSIQNNKISIHSEDIENIRCSNKWQPLINQTDKNRIHTADAQ
jgi:hypothetical protein